MVLIIMTHLVFFTISTQGFRAVSKRPPRTPLNLGYQSHGSGLMARQLQLMHRTRRKLSSTSGWTGGKSGKPRPAYLPTLRSMLTPQNRVGQTSREKAARSNSQRFSRLSFSVHLSYPLQFYDIIAVVWLIA
jgi:hypothetical protein